MYLTDFISKHIYVGKTLRGVCLGLGISPKSFAVKYLLCISGKEGKTAAYAANCDCDERQKYAFVQNKETDFVVNLSAVEDVETDIRLSRLRLVFPKNCWKVFLGTPIFAADGNFLGRLANAEIAGERIVRLIADNGAAFSPTLLTACADVLILRKEQPYPLGQRIPAPAILHISDGKEGVVSKSILKSVIQKSTLIRFTLSLSPFSMEYVNDKNP